MTQIIHSKPWLDALFDGGVRVPSLTLIGGAPGAGRTTFALQFIRDAKLKGRAIYITCVGDWRVTKEIATGRMAIREKDILFAGDNADVFKWLQDPGPRTSLIIIDAFRDLSGGEKLRLVRAAKMTAASLKIPVFIITEMTKSHDFPGPMEIQYIANVLLTIYASADDGARELTVWKNTFGATRVCRMAMAASGFEVIPKRARKDTQHV